MFILAHNDPVWIGVGMLVGVVVGILMVKTALFQNRK